MSICKLKSASRPVVLLSLDGGGINGLSSLYILEDILEKIPNVRDTKETLRPCEIFDFIGGTGSGGIIAIMLGRFGMTIGQAIDFYKGLVGTVVSELNNNLNPYTGIFLATELEKLIKKMICENCSDSQCAPRPGSGKPKTDTCVHQDMFFRDKGCTKTAVLALTKVDMDAPPTVLSTYDTSSRFSRCTVWEVANAIAADNISGSIKTGRDEEELVDATYGYKNPCEVLITEAKGQFPGREMIILSIGTGVNNVVEISDSSEALATALREIAATSKRSELRLQSDYGGSGVYHRFNVEKGLRDTKSLTSLEPGAISAHTRNYIRENETSILNFVEAFTYASSLPLPQTEEGGISSFTLPHEEQSSEDYEKKLRWGCYANTYAATNNGTKRPPTICNHADGEQCPPGSREAGSRIGFMCLMYKRPRFKKLWSSWSSRVSRKVRGLNLTGQSRGYIRTASIERASTIVPGKS